MFFNDSFARTVRLPVRHVDGKWQMLDGTDLPRIEEGAVGEIVLDAHEIVEVEVRERLSQERRVPFLPKGTILWARVEVEHTPSELRGAAHAKKCQLPDTPGSFVMILLKDDLNLCLRANKDARLADCRCSIPGLPHVEARSVNHAYTLISTQFEPKRRSHSGNVFQKVYCEDDSRFRLLQPLNDRRLEVEFTHSADDTGEARLDGDAGRGLFA